MKKVSTLIVAAALTFPVITSAQVTQFSTSTLSTFDCASLAVEKNNANRQIKEAQTALDNAAAAANNPANSVSKFAGMAGSALSAFGGNSQKASKANEIANNLSANDTSVSEQQIAQYRSDLANAQANVENIGIYQNTKKCK